LRRIVVLSSSEANFDAEYSVCTNELTITNNSADALEYLWDFGDSTTSSDKDPEHNYNEPGTYNIKLIVNPGTLCEAIDSQEIVVSEEVDPEVVLYNSFSPNGDGINDCFYFDGLDLECSEMRWMVYNRWGEKVFETDNPGNCWNGASFNNGETLPESTYYYILDLGYKSRNSQRYSGTITLFKQ
jgi:gliding motility-associated-like protein